MLERNRLKPPRPYVSSQTVGWSDVPTATDGGIFASAEDYDATGILAGVDPCESRYWWMPELFTSAAMASNVAAAAGRDMLTKQPEKLTEDVPGASPRRTGLADRLMHPGQAARRSGSRTTAAA